MTCMALPLFGRSFIALCSIQDDRHCTAPDQEILHFAPLHSGWHAWHCPCSGDPSFRFAPFRMTCIALPRFRRFFIPLRSIQNDMHGDAPVREILPSAPLHWEWHAWRCSPTLSFIHSHIHTFTHSHIHTFKHGNTPYHPHSLSLCAQSPIAGFDI